MKDNTLASLSVWLDTWFRLRKMGKQKNSINAGSKEK